LGHPKNILDISRHLSRVERKLLSVLEFGGCILFDEGLTLAYDLEAVIIIIGSGYFFAHADDLAEN
jgi:hypothetical protein